MIQCPSCGGALRFDIASQHMICDACGSHYDPASTASMNKDAKGNQIFESYVFTCPSCGGELLTTDQTDAVGFCPFCGGASMLYDRVHQQWEPQYIIPFQVTKEQCKEIYLKAAKRSIFTSKKYRDPQLIESFRGIYMPYWHYHAVQRGPYLLKGKREGSSQTSYYDITGDMDATVSGYGHDASKAFDDHISEVIAPFDPQGHRPFAPGYLSGFYADIGDVSAYDYGAGAVTEMSQNTAETMIKMMNDNAVGGYKDMELVPSSFTPNVLKDASVVPTEVNGADRVLYPVWFMSYRNKDHINYSVVNGQTGKLYTELPASPWRMLTAIAVIALLLIVPMCLFLPSVKANVTLMFSAVLLSIGHFLLANWKKSKKSNPLSSGMDDIPEVEQYHKTMKWMRIIVLVSAAIGLIVGYNDPAHNIISYGLSFLLLIELLITIFLFIRLQVKLARRKPPQFNKEGAQYDEK